MPRCIRVELKETPRKLRSASSAAVPRGCCSRNFLSDEQFWNGLGKRLDAARIVPPTGARGLNSAASDIYYLYRAMVSFTAAAAHALDQHVARLAADHRLAKKLFLGLYGLPGLQVEPPDTNIVLVALTGDVEHAVPQLMRHLRSRGVLASALYGQLRLVTHLDVDEAATVQAIDAVRDFVTQAIGQLE